MLGKQVLLTGLVLLQHISGIVAQNTSSQSGAVVTQTVTEGGGPPPWVRSCLTAAASDPACAWMSRGGAPSTATATATVSVSVSASASQSTSSTISSINPTSTAEQTGTQPTAISTTPDTETKRPNIGAIVGAATGVSIALIAVVLGFAFVLWRRRQRRTRRDQLPKTTTPSSDRDDEEAILVIPVQVQDQVHEKPQLHADDIRTGRQELAGSPTTTAPATVRSVGGLEELPATPLSQPSSPRGWGEFGSPVSPESQSQTPSSETNTHPLFRKSLFDML